MNIEKQFKDSETEYQAILNYIQEVHKGVYRRDTRIPYYVHPVRVANLVMSYRKQFVLDGVIITALLHDVLEDTSVSKEEIRDNWGTVILDRVLMLTLKDEEVSKVGKTQALINAMMQMDESTLLIKLCDRLDNVTDFVFTDSKFAKKYMNETLDILSAVEEEKKDLTLTHKKVINRIINMMDAAFQESSIFDAIDILKNGVSSL